MFMWRVLQICDIRNAYENNDCGGIRIKNIDCFLAETVVIILLKIC